MSHRAKDPHEYPSVDPGSKVEDFTTSPGYKPLQQNGQARRLSQNCPSTSGAIIESSERELECTEAEDAAHSFNDDKNTELVFHKQLTHEVSVAREGNRSLERALGLICERMLRLEKVRKRQQYHSAKTCVVVVYIVRRSCHSGWVVQVPTVVFLDNPADEV